MEVIDKVKEYLNTIYNIKEDEIKEINSLNKDYYDIDLTYKYNTNIPFSDNIKILANNLYDELLPKKKDLKEILYEKIRVEHYKYIILKNAIQKPINFNDILVINYNDIYNIMFDIVYSCMNLTFIKEPANNMIDIDSMITKLDKFNDPFICINNITYKLPDDFIKNIKINFNPQIELTELFNNIIKIIIKYIKNVKSNEELLKISNYKKYINVLRDYNIQWSELGEDDFTEFMYNDNIEDCKEHWDKCLENIVRSHCGNYIKGKYQITQLTQQQGELLKIVSDTYYDTAVITYNFLQHFIKTDNYKSTVNIIENSIGDNINYFLNKNAIKFFEDNNIDYWHDYIQASLKTVFNTDDIDVHKCIYLINKLF
jgi:hypothetical protein